MLSKQGYIIIAEEDDDISIKKFAKWFAVMIVFILVILWGSDFFTSPECEINPWEIQRMRHMIHMRRLRHLQQTYY